MSTRHLTSWLVNEECAIFNFTILIFNESYIYIYFMPRHMYKYIKNNVHNMLITFQEIPSCDAFSRLQDGI